MERRTDKRIGIRRAIERGENDARRPLKGRRESQGGQIHRNTWNSILGRRGNMG